MREGGSHGGREGGSEGLMEEGREGRTLIISSVSNNGGFFNPKS